MNPKATFIAATHELLNTISACTGDTAQLAHRLSQVLDRLGAVVSQANAQFRVGDRYATFNQSFMTKLVLMDERQLPGADVKRLALKEETAFISNTKTFLSILPPCTGDTARLAHRLSQAIDRLESVVNQARAQFNAGGRHATFSREFILKLNEQ